MKDKNSLRNNLYALIYPNVRIVLQYEGSKHC